MDGSEIPLHPYPVGDDTLWTKYQGWIQGKEALSPNWPDDVRIENFFLFLTFGWIFDGNIGDFCFLWSLALFAVVAQGQSRTDFVQ